MGCKPAETTCNTNKAFGPGTAHEHTVRWWFKKFCKGDENLEDEEWSGRPSEVDDQLRAVTEADPFTTTWEVAQELSVNHSMVGWHLKQIGKLKELGASWADRTSKKSLFWSGVFSYSTQQIVSPLDCDMSQKVTFTWQLVMTSSAVGPRRSSEALSKAKLAPKKVMVTIWWSPAGLIHYSFLNPDETITSEKYAQQINKMHWKPQCLQLVLVNRKGPILHDNAWPHMAQLMLQKLNRLGTRLCLICHIHLCQGTFNFKESYMLFSVSQGPSVPYQFLGNRNEQSCTQFSGLRSRGRTHTWIPFSNLLLFCKTT